MKGKTPLTVGSQASLARATFDCWTWRVSVVGALALIHDVPETAQHMAEQETLVLQHHRDEGLTAYPGAE